MRIGRVLLHGMSERSESRLLICIASELRSPHNRLGTNYANCASLLRESLWGKRAIWASGPIDPDTNYINGLLLCCVLLGSRLYGLRSPVYSLRSLVLPGILFVSARITFWKLHCTHSSESRSSSRLQFPTPLYSTDPTKSV